MPATKKLKKALIPDAGNVVINQTLTTPMYEAICELQKEKFFDSPQAVIRVAVGDFLRRNGRTIN